MEFSIKGPDPPSQQPSWKKTWSKNAFFKSALPPCLFQGQGKVKERSRKGQGKVKARSMQGQGKVKARSRQGQGKVKARSR